MRSFLVLAVLVTASQAFSVFQNPPCSGTTPCLINCVVNSRCPIFNPTKPILLAGPTCDRFYKCESGRACETLCPGGTHFNIREQVCDWPHRACCDPSVECRPDPCGPNGDCTVPAPPTIPIPPPPPPPVVPQPPCSGSGICANNCPVDYRCPQFDGSKPTLLPGQNCGTYAKCVAGRACPMACPAGLHFNSAKQICDWPFQACCDPSVECRPDPCGPSGDCGGGGGIIPTPPPPPPPPPPIVPQPPCSGSGICAINCPVDYRCPQFDGAKPTLLPGQNCGSYAKCIAGRACPMACPAGLHFNSAKQICDWPFQACCDPSVECRPDPCGPSGDCGGGGGIIPTPPPPPPPPPPIVPQPPCSGSGICANNCPVDYRCPQFDGSKPTLLPGQNCGSYAKCIAGRACPMACPAGLHFNNAKQICDWPFQACCDPSVECRPDPCPPGAFGCGQNNNFNNNNNWMWG